MPQTLSGGTTTIGRASPGGPAYFTDDVTIAPDATLDVTGYAVLGDPTHHLLNYGAILVGGADTQLQVESIFGNPGLVRVEDGATLQVDGSFGNGHEVDVGGGGTVALGGNAGLIRIEDGAANIVATAAITAQLDTFQQGDTLTLQGVAYDPARTALQVQANPYSTSVTITEDGAAVAQLALAGAAYSTDNLHLGAAADGDAVLTTDALPDPNAAHFGAESGGGGGAAAGPPGFAWTDTVTGASGTDSGQAYVGPVAGLQAQYIWGGSDGVAIAALRPDVFLHGGPGDDALQAAGGSNVLDGGTGSNFLVGGDGTDTFFADARGGGDTWDTLVGFHAGDAVTLWGFDPATSTLAWAAQEGAAGYQGATLHAAIGAGTEASITFAGLDLATAQAHLTASPGSVDGNACLQLAWTP